jgi:hypothetical protein
MQLRGVGYSQFHLHISNIRKVQTFLGTLHPDSPALLTHLERLQPWLSTLNTQLEYQFPKVNKTPTHWDLIKHWTDLLVGECNVVLDQPPLMITKAQAFFIQSVIQILIFVGRYTPPLRAGVVRDLMHPSKVSGCLEFSDPDVDPASIHRLLDLDVRTLTARPKALVKGIDWRWRRWGMLEKGGPGCRPPTTRQKELEIQ